MGLFRSTPDPTGKTDYGLLEASPDDLVGTTLQDTYIIDRIVGEGGMGRVYESHHTRIARKRYAIKVLRAEMAGSPEVRSRFQREADAAASIEHPNVVAVSDFGYAPDGRPYLVCEYLDGIELSQFIQQKRRLDVPKAIAITRQICHALEAAHQKGVIHRDLKPENVFLVGSLDEPEVKVLDFGLSRFMEAQSTHATRTGMVMGTPAYMAPEQARGERADHRVDIYGVGAILYCALTGHSPFEEDSPQAAVLAVMSKEPPRPRAHEPSIPEQVELVVQRAMAREPAERYQSMAELDAALSVFEMTRIEVPEIGGPREQLLSAALGSIGDEDEVGNARTQVVLMLCLAFVLLLMGLVSTLDGGQTLLWGKKLLSTTEFSLIVAAVVGTLITPTVLFVRWIKGRFWNNSVKMLELARKLRGPVIGAAAVYGIVILFGRTLDGCGTQVGSSSTGPDVSGWAGWNPIVFLVATAGALAIGIRRWLLFPTSGFVRRVIAGPVVIGATVVLAGVLLQYGFRTKSSAVVATPRPEAPAKASGSAAESETPAPIPAPAAGSVELPAEARAPSEKLAEAIPKGADALLDLRAKYPRDPAVLEPLALALGQQQSGYGQAIEALDALFTVAPHKASDKELDALIIKIALAAGDPSNKALEVMAKRMGKLGPDMLYDLMLTSNALRHAAREKLDDAETKKNFSPELASAFELRTAKSCEDRLPMLGRALRSGDSRAAAVLLSLSTGTKRGCGPRQNKSCPAPCSPQAAQFKRTAVDIQNRLATRK